LASIPVVCSMFGSFCGGYASDRLIARGMQIVQARKLPAALGYLGSALFTAFAALSTAPARAILWISLAMFFLYFAVAAKWTLITAVSPQDYCGSCSSIQNFGSYLGGACSPVLTRRFKRMFPSAAWCHQGLATRTEKREFGFSGSWFASAISKGSCFLRSVLEIQGHRVSRTPSLPMRTD
jgi:MFS family permease